MPAVDDHGIELEQVELRSTSSSPTREPASGDRGQVDAGPPRRAVEQGGAAQRAQRALDPLGRGRQRHDRDVVERLGPDPPERRRTRAGTTPSARAATSTSTPGRAIRSTSSSAPAASGSGEQAPAGARAAPRSSPSPSASRADLALVPEMGDRRASARPASRARRRARPRHRRSRPRRRPGTATPASRSDRLRLGLAEPSAARRRGRPAGGRGRRDLAQPGGIARRAGAARTAQTQRGRSPAIAGRPRPASSQRSLVVEQVGEGGGEHRRGARLERALGERPCARRPTRPRARRRARAGGRSRAAAGRSPGRAPTVAAISAQAVGLAPRSATCSRAGWRRSRRRAAAPRAARGSRGASGRQVDPEPLRLVGGEPRVAARAGEHREAAVAARPRPRLGQRPGELEQLVRIGGPGGARLLDQRPEHPLVAGERAGVSGRRARRPPPRRRP